MNGEIENAINTLQKLYPNLSDLIKYNINGKKKINKIINIFY